MNITISIDYRTVWGERLVLVLSDGKRVDMTYSSAKWVAMFSMPKSAKTINYIKMEIPSAQSGVAATVILLQLLQNILSLRIAGQSVLKTELSIHQCLQTPSSHISLRLLILLLPGVLCLR